ncbi:hypothetical protein KAR34_03500 [bacterium]|nr:hypothetical protein [bacterium]
MLRWLLPAETRLIASLLIFASLLILLLWLPVMSQAKIDLSGAIRNDAVLIGTEGEPQFNNIVENKLILQRKAEDWKFYSDVRFYLYTGDAVGAIHTQKTGTSESPTDLSLDADYFLAKVLRVFVRWYTDSGDFTLGKTYVSFGNLGVFNPFEIDSSINVSDLSYTKDGLVALSYDLPLGDLSGLRVYVSPEAQDSEVSAGTGIFTNLSGFDVGMVANRAGRDDNIAGVYFKGDLELGVQGSYAYHFNDQAQDSYSEATLGLDYSFFEGEWLLGTQVYYNGNEGRGDRPVAPTDANTNTLNAFAQLDYAGFTDTYYLYGNLVHAPHEFFRFQLDAFVNLEDYSSLIVHTLAWVLSDGLNLSLQWMIPTGVGDTQYSREVLGKYIVLLRAEAKL